MIYCLTCSCGGVDKTVREALNKAGDKEWLVRPIVRGKQNTITAIRKLEKEVDGLMVADLELYANGRSKFAIILGVEGTRAAWRDLLAKDQTSAMEAIDIIKRYA